MTNDLPEHSEEKRLFATLDEVARKQLVRLVVAGMPLTQMSDYLSIPLSQVQELLDDPELKQLVAARTAQDYLANSETGATWDKVEKMAISNVLAELKNRPDPEYSLRAAVAANKAIRNHKNTQEVQQQIESGAKIITLSLNQTVVNNLTATKPESHLVEEMPKDGKIIDVFTSFDMNRLAGGLSQKPLLSDKPLLEAKPKNAAKFDFDVAFEEILNKESPK